MSSEATDGQIPDVYGQVHPVETEELISRKQKEFEEELEKIPEAEKENAMKAQEKCPSLLTNDFKLKFLRCEVFNADLAARRYAQYWDKRVGIFGPEKAFHALTLADALADDDVPFSLGVMTLLPNHDPSGRSLLYYDPAKFDRAKHETDSVVRTFWYVFHAALEHETTQQHGIILLVDPGRASYSHFDSSVGKHMVSCLKGALPIRLSAVHILHPPSFATYIFPVIKLFMPERMRQRIRFHSGSDDEVLQELENTFGLTRAMLPKEVGGDVSLDHDEWLKSRSDLKF